MSLAIPSPRDRPGCFERAYPAEGSPLQRLPETLYPQRYPQRCCRSCELQFSAHLARSIEKEEAGSARKFERLIAGMDMDMDMDMDIKINIHLR